MISIRKSEAEFMLENLELPPELKIILRQQVMKIELSDDQADELRDCCTCKLDEIGFDENYEPSEKGKVLESLVDKLYIG